MTVKKLLQNYYQMDYWWFITKRITEVIDVMNIRLFFSDLKDERQGMKVQHDLLEIIAMTIISVAADCDGWDEIEDFCLQYEDWLKEVDIWKLKRQFLWCTFRSNSLRCKGFRNCRFSPKNRQMTIQFCPFCRFCNSSVLLWFVVSCLVSDKLELSVSCLRSQLVTITGPP